MKEKKTHRPGKGGPGFGIICYGAFIFLILFITFPFFFHQYKYHVDNTLSLFLASPAQIGMSEIQEIQNENPFFDPGAFMVQFKITPEGVSKLLDVHDWKEVEPSADRDYPQMLGHLKNANGATCYEWDSETSRVRVDLVLNAARTQGVVYFEGI